MSVALPDPIVNPSAYTDTTIRWRPVAQALAALHISLVARRLHCMEAGVCLTCHAVLDRLDQEVARAAA